MKAVLSLLVFCAACTANESRPHVDRSALIALTPVGDVASIDAAARVWFFAGVRFERCADGIPVRVEPGLSPDLVGEYRWTALGPIEVVIRFDDATVLAHELGHVLGLDHLADEDVGLMSRTPLSDALTEADLAEYERAGQ